MGGTTTATNTMYTRSSDTHLSSFTTSTITTIVPPRDIPVAYVLTFPTVDWDLVFGIIGALVALITGVILFSTEFIKLVKFVELWAGFISSFCLISYSLTFRYQYSLSNWTLTFVNS